MLLRIFPGGALAAIAGAGMLFLTAAPSAAFTLSSSSPTLVQPAVSGQIEKVWWDRWGYWHPNRPWGWRRWGWGPRPYYGYYGYGYGPVRRCWRGPLGALHCRW